VRTSRTGMRSDWRDYRSTLRLSNSGNTRARHFAEQSGHAVLRTSTDGSELDSGRLRIDGPVPVADKNVGRQPSPITTEIPDAFGSCGTGPFARDVHRTEPRRLVPEPRSEIGRRGGAATRPVQRRARRALRPPNSTATIAADSRSANRMSAATATSCAVRLLTGRVSRFEASARLTPIWTAIRLGAAPPLRVSKADIRLGFHRTGRG